MLTGQDIHFNRLKTRNPNMGTLANSEDPDEMPHYVAFHPDLHCLIEYPFAKTKTLTVC